MDGTNVRKNMLGERLHLARLREVSASVSWSLTAGKEL